MSGKAVPGTPKTKSGVRDLHLAAETVALLRRHLHAEGGRAVGHVFTNAKGQQRSLESQAKLASGAGLGDVRFHDLRHTYASLMLSKGVLYRWRCSARSSGTPGQAPRRTSTGTCSLRSTNGIASRSRTYRVPGR